MTLRAALLAGLIPLTLAAAALADDKDAPRVLSVTGRGEVSAAPDMAVVTFGASFRERAAKEAVAKVANAMDEVMKALGELDIAPRDLQTSTLTLNPVYHHLPDSPPRLDGYEARNSVTVRLRDIAKTGAAIDAATAAGVTEFGGISFGFAEPQPLQDAALKAAMEDAARKARLVAEAAGVTLGEPRSVNIGGYGGGRPQPMHDMAMMRAEAAPMPVSAGESTLEATVSVVYEID